jgi:TonB family protein
MLLIVPGLAARLSAGSAPEHRTAAPSAASEPREVDLFAALDRLKDADLPVRLNFVDVPLEEVFEALGRTSGLRIKVKGDLPRCEEIEAGPVPLRDVLIRLGLDYDLLYDVPDWETLEVRRPHPLDEEGVTEPKLIPAFRVTPTYPEEARRAGASGHVVLQAVILTDGSVTSIRPLREVPDWPSLTQSAIDAVSQWRYEPATIEGRPVEVFFTVNIKYALDGKGKGKGEHPDD